MRNFFKARIRASFTVESAVIIPVFTFITVALVAMGFHIRNNVMVKSLCWKSAMELERITTLHPNDDRLYGAAGELRERIRDQGMFLKNIRTSVDRSGSLIEVSASADSSFILPVFGRIGSISVTEKADAHNPATDMRRWHALGMLTGR